MWSGLFVSGVLLPQHFISLWEAALSLRWVSIMALILDLFPLLPQRPICSGWIDKMCHSVTMCTSSFNADVCISLMGNLCFNQGVKITDKKQCGMFEGALTPVSACTADASRGLEVPFELLWNECNGLCRITTSPNCGLEFMGIHLKSTVSWYRFKLHRAWHAIN